MHWVTVAKGDLRFDMIRRFECNQPIAVPEIMKNMTTLMDADSGLTLVPEW